MELRLTSEQSLLRDSAAKFAGAAGAKVARGYRGQSPSFSPARLHAAGELGWLGILVPPAEGGLGLGLTELALVLEQAGMGLLCEPVGLAAVSAAALSQGAHPMLKAVMSGSALVVPALDEDPHGADPFAPRAQAQVRNGALRVSGAKMFVCADGAAGFLVSASGGEGPVLCYVSREAPGCTLSQSPTVEGRALARMDLVDTPAEPVASHPSSRNAVEATYNLALFAFACELLGVMERAKDITLDYLRLRKQFGKPIGSFQAIQHQAVNMYVRAQAVRSLIFAIAASNDPYGIDPAMAVTVKAKASEEALAVTQTCIQLHGAIGFTDEHEMGLFLKRAMLLSSLLGNAAAQRRRYVTIAGLNA